MGKINPCTILITQRQVQYCLSYPCIPVIRILKIAVTIIFFLSGVRQTHAQRFNAGFIFQYHFLKQIDVNSSTITGTFSHDIFKVKENNWKAFAAGQSIVVGMMAQLDYKKFYLTTELSYNLNTYRYTLYYTLGPSTEEEVYFKTLYQQLEIPLYLGYQFQSTNLVRYSVFGGALVNVPMLIETYLDEGNSSTSLYDRYDSNDLRYILYDDQPYLSSIVGFGVHIASLAKVDVRYMHRFGSPGDLYDVKFNTVGLALTYYLPLSLRKKRIYYEE